MTAHLLLRRAALAALLLLHAAVQAGTAIVIGGATYRVRPRPGDLSPELGFEFRLYKGPGTMGWFSNALGGDDYTVLKVRLDVTPVRMAAPLFTPLVPSEAAPAAAPARPG